MSKRKITLSKMKTGLYLIKGKLVLNILNWHISNNSYEKQCLSQC